MLYIRSPNLTTLCVYYVASFNLPLSIFRSHCTHCPCGSQCLVFYLSYYLHIYVCVCERGCMHIYKCNTKTEITQYFYVWPISFMLWQVVDLHFIILRDLFYLLERQNYKNSRVGAEIF